MTDSDTSVKPSKLSPVQLELVGKIVDDTFNLSNLDVTDSDDDRDVQERADNFINQSKKRIDRRIHKNFKNILQYDEFNLFVHQYTYKEIAVRFLEDEHLIIALDEKLGKDFTELLKKEALKVEKL